MVSQPEGRIPPKVHKINLRGREMIDGRRKKKKQSADAHFCIHLSWMFFRNVEQFHLFEPLPEGNCQQLTKRRHLKCEAQYNMSLWDVVEEKYKVV